MLKLILVLSVISLNVFGSDACTNLYHQAISTKNTDPNKAIYEFSKAFEICEEPTKGRTLLQSATIYLILLMEPHQALSQY